MPPSIIRHRTISSSQLDLLIILYSYRFSTVQTLGQIVGGSPKTLYKKLGVLVKHGYIARRYDSSYKLSGREAEYYVLPKGLRTLRDHERMDVTDTALRALYRDKTVSLEYVQRHVLFFKVRNALVASYTDLQYFATRDLQQFVYFPSPRPTGFLSLAIGNEKRRYFIEYIAADLYTAKLRQRIMIYITFIEANTWAVTNTPFPYLLFVCENTAAERLMRRIVRKELDEADINIPVYTTTQDIVLRSPDRTNLIWSDLYEDELVGLLEMV